MWEQVKALLAARVQPRLAQHGGGVELLKIVDDVVYVRLTGQCSGCPAAYLTTESLIFAELSAALPRIRRVVADSSVSDELLAQAKAILHGCAHAAQ